ncbi:hypothetical protein jhhlp_005019 [Lomentospora prolificans]|uniref:Aminoglycoside phosphotransferase domain-containing protein n=1 Tax=Lomentospora prolificans TaxID=41688 RepID=A0A2N3N8F1_9PEZI|nr:hypothetical protein jhhlp_005019 [Lomentospora prolificans]
MTIEVVSTSVSGAVDTAEPTLQLLNRPPITYRQALDTDKNIIHEASYVEATNVQYQKLWEERDLIRALVNHHLTLKDGDNCVVADPRRWIRGSFNVCIPIEVQSTTSPCRKLLLRCAMPHKLAEAKYPGSIDEKMGCEVGAYAWMQERCSTIRIPNLYGFGFSDHSHSLQFTHEAYRSLFVRSIHRLRRWFRRLAGYTTLLSRYISHPTMHRLSTPYMLLEDVSSDTSEMLSNTWDEHRTDPARRKRLFRGIAQLMLSLARVPQPRIGSFRFHDDGSVTLTNRPLICSTMILENDGTPRTIQRNNTYLSTDAFVADLFNFHDKRFLSHPNAVFDNESCYSEMATRVLLRAVSHHYIRKDQRNGPFFLQLDDFHASNIFVDKDWNITCVIDLEWISSLPVEKLAVPYWLTGSAIDDIHEHLTEFDIVRREFMDIFEEEEREAAAEHSLSLAHIMRENWESGSVWFWYGITSINAMYSLFTDHLCRRFLHRRLSLKEEELIARFWSEDASEVVECKVKEYHGYERNLRGLFDKGVTKNRQAR